MNKYKSKLLTAYLQLLGIFSVNRKPYKVAGTHKMITVIIIQAYSTILNPIFVLMEE